MTDKSHSGADQPEAMAAAQPLTRLRLEAEGGVDTLDRAGFARHLLEIVLAIDADQGAVIGLIGAWGSGKTWLLERARAAFEEERPSARWVAFSPWQLSGSQALIEALLAQIGEAIRLQPTLKEEGSVQRGAALADAFIDLAQALGALRHLAPALVMMNQPELAVTIGAIGAAAHAASQGGGEGRGWLKRLTQWGTRATPGSSVDLSLAAKGLLLARDRVRDAVQALGERLVIVIDDVDRMTPREIADIVQLVKAVADFTGVVYLLAYDPAVVVTALETVLMVPDGRAYLEKIVPVCLLVPPLHVPRTTSSVQACVQRALDYAHWQVQDAHREDLEHAVPIASALIDGPRDLQRLELHLKIAAKALKGDICPADLLLIELVRLKAAEVLDFIEAHAGDFLAPDHHWVDEAYRARGLVAREASMNAAGASGQREWPALRALTEANGPAAGRRLWEALLFMFDAINRRSGLLRAAVLPYRLQRLPNWLRWRGLAAHDEWTRNSKLQWLLESAERIRNSPYWPDVQKFGEFLILTDRFVDGRSDFDIVGLITLITEAANACGGLLALADLALGFQSLVHIQRLVEQCPSTDRLRATQVLVAAEFLWDAGKALEGVVREEDKRAADSELDDLIEKWQDKAVGALRTLEGVKKLGQDGVHPLEFAAFIVKKMDVPPRRVRNALEEFLSACPEEGLALTYGVPVSTPEPGPQPAVDHEPWTPSSDFLLAVLSFAPRYAEAHRDQVVAWRRLAARETGEAQPASDSLSGG